MTSETLIAQHLCTRLCHDLTGPIGAINNGAEFMTEQEFDMQNEAMQLIASSAGEAVARLQFYRQAYGKLNEHGEACLDQKKQIVEAFFLGSKITLDWPDKHTDAAGVSISQKMAQLMLNQIIIASRTLIRGGILKIRITSDGSGDREVLIEASGPSIKEDAIVTEALNNIETVEVSPKSVQVLLTMKLAKEMNVILSQEMTEDRYTLSAIRADHQRVK